MILNYRYLPDGQDASTVARIYIYIYIYTQACSVRLVFGTMSSSRGIPSIQLLDSSVKASIHDDEDFQPKKTGQGRNSLGKI